MNKEDLIKKVDYYRNKFQLALKEIKQLRVENECYQILSAAKEDLIENLNKRIDILSKSDFSQSQKIRIDIHD